MSRKSAFIASLLFVLLATVAAIASRSDVVSSGNDAVLKFGRNSDVDQTQVEIWDGITARTLPTQGRVHNITSTDVKDDLAGVGARTLRIWGTDENYLPVTEDLDMDGTSNVATTLSYTDIYRMKVLTSGAEGDNAGTITATAVTDATVTSQITASNNQTGQASFTVPAGKVGYMTSYYATMNRSGGATNACTIILYTKEMTSAGVGVWHYKHSLGLQASGSSYFKHPFDSAFVIPGPAHIRLDALCSANNNDISAGFDLRVY